MTVLYTGLPCRGVGGLLVIYVMFLFIFKAVKGLIDFGIVFFGLNYLHDSSVLVPYAIFFPSFFDKSRCVFIAMFEWGLCPIFSSRVPNKFQKLYENLTIPFNLITVRSLLLQFPFFWPHIHPFLPRAGDNWNTVSSSWIRERLEPDIISSFNFHDSLLFITSKAIGHWWIFSNAQCTTRFMTATLYSTKMMYCW